jgi:histone H3/H4
MSSGGGLGEAGNSVAAATATEGATTALLLGGGAGPPVEVQGMVGLQGGSRVLTVPVAGPASAADVTQVFTELHSDAAALGSVLQPTPFTSEELSGVIGTATGVTSDPESLRFQFPMEDHAPSKKKATPTVYREQDRFLPINNVSRVMRNAIPRNGKVSKDAKECMQECVSEFVSFITSEAADRCSQEKRKTLTGDDILFAMANLGFDNYIEPMKLYLQKTREYMKVEKTVAPSVADQRTLMQDSTGDVTSHPVLTEETTSLILQPPPPPSSSISPLFSPSVS